MHTSERFQAVPLHLCTEQTKAVWSASGRSASSLLPAVFEFQTVLMAAMAALCVLL